MRMGFAWSDQTYKKKQKYLDEKHQNINVTSAANRRLFTALFRFDVTDSQRGKSYRQHPHKQTHMYNLYTLEQLQRETYFDVTFFFPLISKKILATYYYKRHAMAAHEK